MAEANPNSILGGAAASQEYQDEQKQRDSVQQSQTTRSTKQTSTQQNQTVQSDQTQAPLEGGTTQGGPKKLMSYEPDEVRQALDNDEISVDDAEQYTVKKSLAENGLLGMDPEEVKMGVNHGIISVDKADEYADRKESPVTFYLGDVAKGVAGGVAKAAENTVETAGWMAETVLPINQMVFGEKPDYGKIVDRAKKRTQQSMPKLTAGFEDMISPVSTAGQIVEPFAQYGAGLVGLGKFSSLAKTGRLASKLKQTRALSHLSRTNPKTAEWVAQVGEEAIKGNVVDQIAFDPLDSRLSDMLAENGLENAAVSYLKSDPSDTQAEARLKMAAEATFTGLAFDSVLEGLRAAKINVWGRNAGKQADVVQDVNKNVAEPTGVDPNDGVVGSYVKGTQEKQSFGKATEGAGKATGEATEDSAQKKVKDAFMEAARREDGTQKSNVKIADVKRKAKEKGLSDEEATETIKSLRDNEEIELTAGYDPQLFSQQDIEDTKPFTEEASGRYVMKRGSAWEDPIDEASEGATSQRPTDANVDDSQKTGQGSEEGSSKATQGAQGGGRSSVKMTKSEEELTDHGIQVFSELGRNEWNLEQVDDTFINKMELEGSVDAMLRAFRSKNFDAIEGTRGRVKPRAQTEKEATEELAELTKEDPEAVKGYMQQLHGDLKDLDTRIRTMNRFFESYSKSLSDYIGRHFSESGEASLEQELKVIQHMKNLQEMQNAIYGIRTEMGRGLGSGYKSPMEEQVRNFDFANIDAKYGDEFPPEARYQMRDTIKAFRQAKKTSDALQVAKHSGTLSGSRLWLEGALEFIQSNLLWGPDTHLTNIIGGGLAVISNLSKKLSGSLYQGIRHGDTSAAKEMTAAIHGMGAGIIDGFRLPGYGKRNFYDPSAFVGGLRRAWNEDEQAGRIWKALFTAEPQIDPMGKLEGQNVRRGSQYGGSESDTAGSAMQQAFEKTTGLIGVPGVGKSMANMLRIPFHGLTAGDEFMKHIGYFSELHSQAAREGMERGLQGDNLKNYIDGMLKEPSTALHKKAQFNARDVTYTHPLEGNWSKVNKITQTRGGLVGKMAMLPFFRIVVNLGGYGMRHTPLAPASRIFREQWQAGGRERFEAVAGVAQGTALMMLAGSLYENGHITGHIPPEMRETARNKGVQEYSVRVGDKWVSYNRGDPLALLMGVSADIAHTWDVWNELDEADERENQEVEEEFEKVTTTALIGLKEAVLNKFMLRSVHDFMDMIMQPKRTNVGEYLSTTQAEKLFPASSAFSDYQRQIADDLVRRKENFRDMVWSKVRASNNYARRHSVYGTKRHREDAWPFPAIGAFRARRETDDPVMEEMYNLGMSISRPSETLQLQGESQKMSQKQYAQLNDYIAQLPVKETLTKIVKSPGYQNLNDPKVKSKILKSVISEARSAARKKLLAENSDLRGDFMDKFKLRAALIQGSIDESPEPKSTAQTWAETIQ